MISIDGFDGHSEQHKSHAGRPGRRLPNANAESDARQFESHSSESHAVRPGCGPSIANAESHAGQSGRGLVPARASLPGMLTIPGFLATAFVLARAFPRMRASQQRTISILGFDGDSDGFDGHSEQHESHAGQPGRGPSNANAESDARQSESHSSGRGPSTPNAEPHAGQSGREQPISNTEVVIAYLPHIMGPTGKLLASGFGLGGRVFRLENHYMESGKVRCDLLQRCCSPY